MQPGTLLGHYEILEAIGKGGMGEVWRARETKPQSLTLDRRTGVETI